MKRVITVLTVILLGIFFLAPSQASVKKLGQTGMTFLKVGVGARATGMGDAYTLVGQDVSAIFYNPAGLALMKSSFDIMASRTTWIADVTYDAVAVAKNMDTWGTVGASFLTASYGDFMGTQVASNEKGYEETGTFSPEAFTAGLTYAKSLNDKFSVGGNVRYVKQSLGSNVKSDGTTTNNQVSGAAFDFGTVFYPGWRSFRFGMSVRNFSQEFEYEKYGFQLPLTFKISAAMDLMDVFTKANELHAFTLAFDLSNPRDYTQRIDLGVEYWFQSMLALRGGYKFNYDEEGLAIGGGINYDISGTVVKIDYSYAEFGVFNSVNRVSIGLSF